MGMKTSEIVYAVSVDGGGDGPLFHNQDTYTGYHRWIEKPWLARLYDDKEYAEGMVKHLKRASSITEDPFSKGKVGEKARECFVVALEVTVDILDWPI